jgi:L-arabinose isomerase
MGDFAVAEEVLRAKLGLEVETLAAGDLAADVAGVTEADVREEVARDRAAFECALPEEVHARSVRVGLGLRRRLEESGAGAFSLNFLAFDQATGPVDTVPFLEASKAMARGVGYAGEGDVLTAALVGALQRGFGRTTFTEIFCPDWRGDSLFLSHMGEINPEVAADRPRLVEKPFPYTPARPPAVLVCAPKPGKAVLVDLAPGPKDTFRLLVSPVEVLGDSPRPDMRDTIRGWIRPARGVPGFLEEYGRSGGTHHHALVLGRSAEALEAFAAFAGLESKLI